MAITNAGGSIDDTMEQPSVTFVDIETRKLLEKIELDNHAFNTGHLAYQNGDLVVVSAPREGLDEMSLGAVSIRKKNHKLVRFAVVKSIEIHRESVVETFYSSDPSKSKYKSNENP